MQNPLRRYVLLTVLVAIGVTVVQAALISLIVRAYQAAMNRRVAEIGISIATLVLREEVEARRPWPEVEKRIHESLGALGDEDEIALYDQDGKRILRSGSMKEMPDELPESVRATLDASPRTVDAYNRIGIVASGTALSIDGKSAYLIRMNGTFRRAAPALAQLGLGALALPMLLVGLLGAFAILRLTGRQLEKVDRVLRLMASGDLSARMSLPVDPDTAGVVLSFNRMAEKVEETIQKLRRSDEIRRQLLADVTHELNTPLTSVLGYLETLTMDDLPLSPERQRSLTHIAYEEAVNLRALIEDLTTLSRLDAEGLPLEKVRVALPNVVDKVVRRMTHLCERRGVPVRTELTAGVEVRGDPQRLDQVVRNLIENALRHTSPPGDVTVVVRRLHRDAIIEVRDRGAGMSPGDVAKLGQRFLRLDKSRARHTGGRGLGLAITVGLVEAHGGRVAFESELGSGTTVRVTMPLFEATGDAEAVPLAVISEVSGPQNPSSWPLVPATVSEGEKSDKALPATAPAGESKSEDTSVPSSSETSTPGLLVLDPAKLLAAANPEPPEADDGATSGGKKKRGKSRKGR